MIKHYLFTLFIITNYCFSSSLEHFSLKQEDESVAFMLPGQGACAVVVKCIEGENVAVVFDAGASSQKMHVKFLSDAMPSHFLCPRKNSEISADADKQSSLPGKRMRKEDVTLSVDNHSHKKGRYDDAAFSAKEKPAIDGAPLATLQVNVITTPQKAKLKDQILTCQKETVSIDLGKKLNTLLVDLCVTKMIVFLSHTDTDHINLIGHLPDVPAIFCVGGYISGIKEARLKKLLVNKKYAFRFDTYALDLVVDTTCGDFLLTLLQNKQEKDLEYFKNTKVLEKLNFLHLWLLNPKTNLGSQGGILDANSQSYILSVTLQQHNMSMVFCGDATESTFKILRTELSNKNRPIDDIIRCQRDVCKHNVLFSLPHHGSPFHFPEQIFQMFCPSAYFVSAGNGACFPHPHKNLIESLVEKTDQEKMEFFWRSYELTAQSSLCVFSATEHGVGKDQKILPILHRNLPMKPLVLGTNIAGTLYMDTRGVFFQEQTNSVQVAGCNYNIEHNCHAFSGAVQEDKGFLFDKQYPSLTNAGTFYVSDQDKILYKDNQPYAKIYYSPDSKKWLGYLLDMVDPCSRNGGQGATLGGDIHSNNITKVLFGAESLEEEESLPMFVSVNA